MKNELPKRFMHNIIERPVLLNNGLNSQKYDDLAQTLNVMSNEKAVVLDETEAISLFGKSYRQGVKLNLKRRGVNKVRMANKDGKVYIWSTR